ncbi:TPA: hypothetical protein SMR47_000139 [Pseudomonas putida]|nr:hypothetical protein [Pseudomonas putida]
MSILSRLTNNPPYAELLVIHWKETKDGLPRVFANVTPMSYNLPTYVFAALRAPGLLTGERYVKGDNIDIGPEFEGRDYKRDLPYALTLTYFIYIKARYSTYRRVNAESARK